MATIEGDLWDGHGSLLVLLALVVGVMADLFFVVRVWTVVVRGREESMEILANSHTAAADLVRYLVPSFSVQRYQFRGMQPKAGYADIAFNNLSLELKNGRKVLEGVTGHFPAARLCAILGPSGAGKTTFMNVLCGKATYGKMGGEIKVNNVKSDIAAFRSVTGFVPQDDIVHEDLTVGEQIEFSARLRNKAGTSHASIDAITQDVLNVMQIDHIQNSIVGNVEYRGISGGQRKRVNIGLELAAQPTVLFLDEPTSGLDSTASLAIVASLKKLTSLGMTSIMVIHQPRFSVFTLFDDVLLLGKGGSTVYLGSSEGAKPYFEHQGFDCPPNENAADWFMDVIAGEVLNTKVPEFKPAMLVTMWQEHATDIQTRGRTVINEETFGRDVDEGEERALLAVRLRDEWGSIDTNHDGTMEDAELQALLKKVSKVNATPDVVRDLMERMGGVGAKKVTKDQFLEFMCNLKGCLALDSLTEAEGHHIEPVHETAVFSIDDVPDEPRADGMGSDRVSLTSSPRVSSRDSNARHDISLRSKRSQWMDTCKTVRLDPHRGLRRETNSAFLQYRILVLRSLIQWWRLNTQRALFLAALIFGAVILAILDGTILDLPVYSEFCFHNLHTSYAILFAIFCLQVFGNSRPVFWRESASGMSISAYFMSKVTCNVFDLLIQAYLFTAVYFLIRQPKMSFWKFFFPFVCTSWAASGWGFLVSTVVPPRHGPFMVSLLVFICCALLGNPQSLETFLDGGAMEAIVGLFSISRWGVVMNYEHALRIYTFMWRSKVFSKGDYFDCGYWYSAALALFLMGIALRFAAFVGLKFMHRDKQV